MKFKRNLKLESGLQQMDIAPLMDVLFLLLFFAFLTLPFAFQSGINVNLPKAVTSDIIREESIVITITNENVIYFNNKVTTIKELIMALKALKDSRIPVLIKSDRRASVGRIVDIWDLCRNLGIERINIATNQNNP